MNINEKLKELSNDIKMAVAKFQSSTNNEFEPNVTVEFIKNIDLTEEKPKFIISRVTSTVRIEE